MTRPRRRPASRALANHLTAERQHRVARAATGTLPSAPRPPLIDVGTELKIANILNVARRRSLTDRVLRMAPAEPLPEPAPAPEEA